MKLYSTVAREASDEQIIEKSRFIAYVKPVASREEADGFIAAIRKKHKDATHNVPAMVIGDKFQLQWASDDGEPQGTSGAPWSRCWSRKGYQRLRSGHPVLRRHQAGDRRAGAGPIPAAPSWGWRRPASATWWRCRPLHIGWITLYLIKYKISSLHLRQILII